MSTTFGDLRVGTVVQRGHTRGVVHRQYDTQTEVTWLQKNGSMDAMLRYDSVDELGYWDVFEVYPSQARSSTKDIELLHQCTISPLGEAVIALVVALPEADRILVLQELYERGYGRPAA